MNFIITFLLQFFPKPSTHVHVCLTDGVAVIFLPPYAAARIGTHVSRGALTRDLCKGALPTELPRPSHDLI